MSAKDIDTAREFERRAKEVFDESTAALDGPTRAKLTKARVHAMAQAQPVGRGVSWALGTRGLLPAGALAAAAIAAWLIVQQQTIPEPDLDSAALADLEILLGEEELDMLEELEFYTWLEEQPELSPAEPADDSVG